MKTEISKSDYLVEGFCPVSAYYKDGAFTDLRTTVDFEKLAEIQPCEDFTVENIDSSERYRRYKTAKIFDLDYCKTAQKKYHFKVMQDLYSVLWGNKSYLDSAETLVSPKQALKRAKAFYQTKVSLTEQERFLYSIATIGNFLPAPCSNQSLLNGLEERWDKELHLIQAYYSTAEHDFVPEGFFSWLDAYGSWQKFVDGNYLKNSFVDETYHVIKFDSTLNQLSDMICTRSKVMLEEYKKRII